jgi:L-malate glycosyltransferase
MAPLTIFVSHPSDVLTDHLPNGDGLIAFSFIRELALRGHTVHVAAPRAECAAKMIENVIVHEVATTYKTGILHRLEYMYKCRLLFSRLRRRHHFDLVHQLNPVNTGLCLSMLGSGVPLVLGPYWPDWPKDADDDGLASSPAFSIGAKISAVAKVMLLAWQRMQGDAFLISTNAASSKLLWSESAEGIVFQLTPGISAEAFYPPVNVSGSPQDQNIVYVANLWRRKGIYTLLDAFEIVAARHATCRLTIVGGGSEVESVHRRVALMPWLDRISLLGNLERERVAEVLRDSTVFCLPSHGEPFGMAALEAMACGKPIVGTRAGGLQHLVSKNGGRLVPTRDAPALASALLEILGSRELQETMGRHNRQLVEERYDWPLIGEQLEAIYRTVLSRRGRYPGLVTGTTLAASTTDRRGLPRRP